MKNQPFHSGTSSGIRWMAWLNIGVQAVLPLTLALATPSASAAPDTQSAQQSPAPSRLHTFTMGDTLASIATHYTTTIAALRTLNPGRDLDALKPGDRLSVPSAPVHALPDLNSPGQEATAQADDEQARKLAALASSTGSFLSNDPNGDAAASMARGLATGEASSQAQQWLSRFGTARVQIDVDDKLSLKNSQVELLAPLHDTPEQLLFAQGSVHRKDERQQTSLGLGVRRFNDGYMLGANSFLDYDLSRQHARLGLGVEYWRDFLKVNANSYQRLTGWKDSPDVEDYQERPANGWDLRTEAWLPAMPQLGGKLTYEQYYGDEVGLFGKDNRKKDPSAVTVGLTYTPIPLLTLSADQRKGNGGNETTVGAEFNYQIGEPWAKQVDPAGVGALRTLAGSRYDLVERNNHIVLEYRKKQVIQMAAAAHVSGQGGETKSLSVWVNSKYPLSHIDWTAPALLQAGGKLVHDGGPHYSVVLPDYQSDAQHTNVYTLHGVAVDSKGNRSARSETRVTVNAPAVSARHSTFTPASTVLPADGKTQQTLTLAIRDEQQQPVDIALADIQIAVAETQTRAGGIVISKPERVSAGHYEVQVTAGSTPQSITLTPSVQGTALSDARVSTTRSVPEEGNSSFVTSHAMLPADDTTTAQLTFTANDANGAPVEGIAKSLKFMVKGDKGSVSPPDVTVSTIEEHPKGTYTATVKGKLAGRYIVSPYFGSQPVGRLNAEILLKALPPASSTSTLEARPDVIPANDYKTSVLEFVAKDINGKPVTGLSNTLALNVTDSSGKPPAPGHITIDPFQENGTTGVYTTALRSSQAGTYTFVPTIARRALAGVTTTVKVVALPPTFSNSKFEAMPPSVEASGKHFTQLTFTAKDEIGKPVTGLGNTLKFLVTTDAGGSLTPTDFSIGTIKEDGTTGVYTASASGLKADTYTLTPQVGSEVMDLLAIKVQLTALPPDATKSNFDASHASIEADNLDTSTLTFKAKDANDKPVSGLGNRLKLVVTNSPTPPDLTVEPFKEDGTTGVYIAKVRGLLPGTYGLTPQVDSDKMDDLELNVTLIVLPPAKSELSVDNSKILADGINRTGASLRVENRLGNPVSGIVDRVSFIITDRSGNETSDVQLTTITEKDQTGVYWSSLSGGTAGQYYIVPKIDGDRLDSLKAPIELLTTEIIALSAGIPRHIFPVTDNFPTTAHTEASFYPVLANNANHQDYTWTSNVSWLVREEGYLKFITPPSGDSGTITITGTRKGSSVTHSYTFTIRDWYEIPKESLNWSAAMKACSTLGLASVSKAQATRGEGIRALGTVTSEWGYIQPHRSVSSLWLNDSAGAGMRLILAPQYDELPTGAVGILHERDDRPRTICHRSLK
ncbi:inverse autotransporter beta domain-containing protein [Pseudomonas guariconensis]|uniref:inverse autotransporter beta domain-containing protein n=1 Tax=Pseudomonas guariconensis TaxID=1288410 RepID=UPI0018ABAD29|nr:inverse autotransporter beta domain-containing protein [Pseudomonas guariconensis]MBF8758132.1 inverse autotransporter beta domain-containing protein [Pseudomonas guariconensis]